MSDKMDVLAVSMDQALMVAAEDVCQAHGVTLAQMVRALA